MENWPEPDDWADFNAIISNESLVVPWIDEPHFSASTSLQCHGCPSSALPKQTTTVSNSRSEAEKRRRDRINTQLAALRKLIPKSTKMDKAALLGSALERVKDLRLKASEVAEAFTIPTESDEVTVDCDVTSKDKMFIRATVCCDDRPEVFTELVRVLKGLRLRTVKAEISSVGGRIKTDLILCDNNNSNSNNNNNNKKDGDNEDVSVLVSTIKRSLHVVVNKINALSWDESKSNRRLRSKRQRLFMNSKFIP